MVVVDAANGWFASWNAYHKFGRDTKMCLCSLWSAGDTACLPSPGKSFPCFSTRGTHLSPRIPALLELPKTVEETAGNESVAGKAEESRATSKTTLAVLRGSCADSDGDSEHILNSDSVFCAREKRRDAVKSRKGRATKIPCPPFSLRVTMKVWPIVRGDISYHERHRRRHFRRNVTPA